MSGARAGEGTSLISPAADLGELRARVACLAPGEAVEVLQADQIARWSRGERVPAEDYLALLPGLRDHPAAFDLVCGEVLLRRERGEQLDPEEYARRFPQLAGQLRLLGEFEDGLGAGAPIGEETALAGRQPTARKAPPPSVPGYEVLDTLGRGGMGVVYRARHVALDRVVALKVVDAGAVEVGGLERLAVEARSVARLQHPGIVQIHDFGVHDGRPYLALEYCPGGTLAQRLRAGPLPAAEAARQAAWLARAVHAAHSASVVHRDLKPANLLFAAGGTLKVSDFGLAKRLDRDDGLTRTGTVAGTPAYMAPEQVAPDRAPAGPATDVWALGVVLYEMLAGRVPFLGANPLSTMLLIASADPVPVRRLNPQVPADLQTICQKCLEKDPKRRYPSAGELADDLDRFARGEPIRARPPGAWGRAVRWARRRPGVAGLTAGLVAVTLAGVVGVTAALLHALAGWDTAAENEAAALSALDREAVERDRAEGSLYLSQVAQAELRWREDAPGTAALLAGCAPGRRGWEWRYLDGLLRSHLARAGAGAPGWHTGSGWMGALAFTPDGSRLVTSGGGNPFAQGPRVAGQVILWDTATGRRLRALPNVAGPLRAVAVSPDGRTVTAHQATGAVRRWDLEGGRELPRLEGVEGAGVVAYRPDGVALFAGAIDLPDGVGVRLWDVAARKALWSVGIRGVYYASLALARDGRRVAVGLAGRDGAANRVLVFEVGKEKALANLVVPERPSCLAFSPDGARLALCGGTAQVWELGRTRPVWQSSLAAPAACLAWSPDGKAVAAGLASRAVRVWDAATGADRGQWFGHAGRVACVAFHPGSRRLAAGTEQPGEWSVWDLTRRQECLLLRESGTWGMSPEGIGFADGGRTLLLVVPGRPLLRADAATGAVTGGPALGVPARWVSPGLLYAFTPDGALVAGMAERDGEVKVWATATGRQVAALSGLGGVVRRVAISRDGLRVAAAATRRDADGKNPTCTVRVWDVQGKVLLSRTGPAGGPGPALALSGDGTRLAVDTGASPDRLTVWDVDEGGRLWSLGDSAPPVGGLAFSPDGRWLAGGEGQQARVWDARTGRPRHEAALAGPAEALAFSPDGRRLAGADRERVKLWDAATGQPIVHLGGVPPRAGDDGYNAQLAWSRDGCRLAAVRHTGHVVVWAARE